MWLRKFIHKRCVSEHGMKRLCIAISLGLWFAIPVIGQDLPPAPAQGLRDDTRALPDTIKAELSQEIQEATRPLRADVWFNAGTFLRSGQTIRSEANELRQHWSGQRDAILLNYDRSSESFAFSYSPGIWQRYPSVQLLSIGKDSAKIMANKDQPLDQRLAATVRYLLVKMQALEQERLHSTQVISLGYKQLAQLFSLVLIVAATLIFMIGALLRRRKFQAGWLQFFPEIHVGTRYGAPHGGGVCAVKQ